MKERIDFLSRWIEHLRKEDFSFENENKIYLLQQELNALKNAVDKREKAEVFTKEDAEKFKEHVEKNFPQVIEILKRKSVTKDKKLLVNGIIDRYEKNEYIVPEQRQADFKNAVTFIK